MCAQTCTLHVHVHVYMYFCVLYMYMYIRVPVFASCKTFTFTMYISSRHFHETSWYKLTEQLSLFYFHSPLLPFLLPPYFPFLSTSSSSLSLLPFPLSPCKVGTKERKPGPFGGVFSQPPPTEEGPAPQAYLARPGLRVWTADESGKVRVQLH